MQKPTNYKEELEKLDQQIQRMEIQGLKVPLWLIQERQRMAVRAARRRV